MSPENLYICPSLEEIIKASKPDASTELRDAIKTRIQVCDPDDEIVAGAKNFLEDHSYDFDAMNSFLESPAFFSIRKKKPAVLTTIYKLSIAAVFLFVLAGAAWFYFLRETPEEIINKAVFYEPGLPVFASVQGDKEFHELMSAYRLKDAKSGLNYYHSLVIKEPLNDTLNYFGGWLYFQNKQPDSAALSFEKTTLIKNGTYQHKAEYMQAICLYLSNKKDKAKLIFEEIWQDKMNPYNENVEILLNNKKLW